MRERAARTVAMGTGVLMVGAVAGFAHLQQGAARAVDEPRETSAEAGPQVPDSLIALGRQVYDRERCASCHSISGQGSPRSPLDGVGSRLSSEQIRLWIVDPQAIQPGVRKPAFDDLPEAEVEALVAFMQSLTNGRR